MAAAAETVGWSYVRLDADTWQTQLEELLALQSVYDEDFRLLAAPGVGRPEPQPAPTGSGEAQQQHRQSAFQGGGGAAEGSRCLDPEELLTAGPPPELLAAAGGGGGGPSGSNGGGGGAPLGCFVAEALVHVDVPEGGLQLVLELPPPPPLPAAVPAPSPLPLPAADGSPAGGQPVGNGHGPHERSDGPGGWVDVAAKRGGARGGGRGRAGGGGGSPGGEEADGTGGAGGRGGRRRSRGGAGGGGRGLAEAGAGAGDGVGGRGRHQHAGGRGGGRGRGRGRGGSPQQTTCGEAAAAAAVQAQPPPEAGPAAAETAGAGVTTSADGAGAAAGAPASPPAPKPVPPAAAAEVGTDTPVQAGTTLVPFGASVQFLSPIRVTLTLPAAYPASAPPAVELAALWLTAAQAGALVSELHEQWRAVADGGGVPILFLWLDWLKSEALSYLGVRQQLVLGGGGAQAAGAGAGWADGGGAAAMSAAPEGLALSLMRYSARREQDKFNESNISCPICLDQQLGVRCCRLPECGHAFCAACLTTHLRTQLAGGAVDNMRCPDPACRRQLPPYVLQRLMSGAEYERWEALTLQRSLDKMEDLVYCPRCREPCLEDRDHCTLCPRCFFSFCSLCEEAWHPGSTCLDPDARLALLEERRAVGQADRGLSAMERARKEINRRNELKSLALLQSTTKQCPTCSMGVEKVEGCNKMTCSYCGSYFCWRCNKLISGYEHFQQGGGGGGGGCVLFEQQEIDRWNARWQGGAPGARAPDLEYRGPFLGLRQQQDREVHFCACVVCGQRNIKEGGNNNIRCWSCNSHFCYLCRAWLRTKPGAHFGPGRCRQHSDD